MSSCQMRLPLPLGRRSRRGLYSSSQQQEKTKTSEFFSLIYRFNIRNLDTIQATGWNPLERTASDWQKLFTGVRKECHFQGTRTPQGSAVSLIEAGFEKWQVERVAGGYYNRNQLPSDTAVLAS